MGDWRADGKMNGGQASEGPPLSGQFSLPVTEKESERVTREFETDGDGEICKESEVKSDTVR